MNNKKLLELFRECNKDEIYREAGIEVNFAFKRAEDDTLLIFFEPSDGGVDWRNNFAFKKKPYKDMDVDYKVHRGFLKCWKAVEDIVIQKVTEKARDGAYKWRRVVIVGYSHGGALAAFCHECVWFHREDLRHVADGIVGIGFEAPRIYGARTLNPALGTRWNNFFVICNYNDLVTKVPPSWFGFAHVGKVLCMRTRRKVGCIKAHTPREVEKSLLAPCNIAGLRELEKLVEDIKFEGACGYDNMEV